MTIGGRTRSIWLEAVVAPLLLAAVVVLQVRIDAQTRSLAKQKDELFLQSGPLLKKLSLGYDSLLADIYWTRTVQYYGSKIALLNSKFELLSPLLNLTTALDPKLIVAYRFGAMFLSEPLPVGAGRADLAVDLVKRGIATNPDEWRLYSDLGFLYYWYSKDDSDASTAYLEGSKIPKAPAWLGLMAARISEKSGSIDTARMIWTQIYETTQVPYVREKASEHLMGLRALEDEATLNQLAEDYRKRFGRYPASSKELRDAGFIRGIPLDPAGIPYLFGPDGKAQLAPMSPIVIEPPPRGPR
jgi:hypothetical protein